MKEIGMLFKDAMVRGLKNESKTQTRRLKFRGEVGDIVWVKEAFLPKASGIIYRADFESVESAGISGLYGGWKSPLFMSRKYARLIREVTALRQEPLQSISEADAIEEGIEKHSKLDLWRDYSNSDLGWLGFVNPVDSYRSLWISIHGRESWDANPVVNVITFKKV